jgi:hypothetical protein
MLSILIPIYNQDVRPLVYTLAKQCSKLNINYQILCFDDGSDLKYREKNKELAFMFGVNYTEMTENLGRSRIRNWLGRAAYYPHMLFLDGDTRVRHKDFIKNYIAALPFEGVIYGGRNYTRKKPANFKKLLHWKYGKYIESRPARSRRKDPYLNFMSNNFIVTQKIFEACPFEENTKGYGFEDLQYAWKLKNLNFPIRHIDNPTEHGGIENADVFLKKTIQALENLLTLEQMKQIPVTRLLRAYELLKKWYVLPFFIWVTQKFYPYLYDNLKGNNPYLWVLQWWKLYEYSIRKALVV